MSEATAQGPAARGAYAPAPGLADAAVGLVDALADHLAGLLKLRGFRLEAGARAALRRVSLYLLGAGLAVLGFILLSCGAILGLASQVGSLALAFAIVGFAYLVVGALVVLSFPTGTLPQRRHAFDADPRTPGA